MSENGKTGSNRTIYTREFLLGMQKMNNKDTGQDFRDIYGDSRSYNSYCGNGDMRMDTRGSSYDFAPPLMRSKTVWVTELFTYSLSEVGGYNVKFQVFESLEQFVFLNTEIIFLL